MNGQIRLRRELITADPPSGDPTCIATERKTEINSVGSVANRDRSHVHVHNQTYSPSVTNQPLLIN